MKHLLTLALAGLVFSWGTLRAQQPFKIAVDNTKDSRLTLEDFSGELPVEGYSGNEIIITGSSERFEAPERAKGLKPVYPGGSDNTGIGVYMEKDGNKIVLRCLLPITQSADYKIRVPESMALKITRGCAHSGETRVSNMKNEVEFNGCHAIELKNVTGPLVVSTISGTVSVVFSDISKDKPISLASVSGEVDVTIPSKLGVDLEMSTISGNMYTDFELPSDSKEMRRVGGGAIHAKLNGGGTDLSLHSVSGNIYLRKG
jgi:lia operon protein LiaG